MKRIGILIVVILLLIVASVGAQRDEDVVFQASTLDVLSEGDFDGEVNVRQLARLGDFGLGTFNRLDGEMVVLDGEFYRVDSDGNVETVPNRTESPFAVVTHFDVDDSFTVDEATSCEDMQAQIDDVLPSEDLIYAIKVTGEFVSLTTRSPMRQRQPYPTLEEALETQVEFELEDISGTLVGFWVPSEFAEINVEGYHWHFLDDAREAGGHVLECEVADVTVEIDVSDRLRVVLPNGEAAEESE